MFDSNQFFSGGAAGFYPKTIEQSLRFNDNDSAYLSRTPASAGNQKTWTLSFWLKPSNQTINRTILARHDSGSSTFVFRLDQNDDLQIENYVSAYQLHLITNAKFRDSSAWYHILLTIDTTQATASDRARIYVNGEQVTSFSTSIYPGQNTNLKVNATSAHRIGARSPDNYLDAYLAEVHFIDGQSDTASITSGSAVVTGLSDTSTLQIGLSVGGTGIASGTVIESIDSSTQITISENATATNASATLAFTPLQDAFGEFKEGVWVAKAPSVTYGTNGFYLDFANSADIGNDVSGEGNDWTPNNFTASDVVLDSPTDNFATLNPLTGGSSTTSNGNLETIIAPVNGARVSTFAVNSGKWYCEMVPTTIAGYFVVGIGAPYLKGWNVSQEANPKVIVYASTGSVFSNGGWSTSSSTISGTYTTNDVIGIALDMDASTIEFYKNGTSVGSANISVDGDVSFLIGNSSGTSNGAGRVNFGQQDFTYTPPTDYLALSTANLPDPAIDPAQGSSPEDYFGTLTYDGSGSTQTVTGLDFEPNFVWIKSRSNATSHYLHDSVRGDTKYLFSNDTASEGDWDGTGNGMVQFVDGGFELAGGTGIDGGSRTYVAWNWKANGSGSTIAAGSIDGTNPTIASTVSANTESGFSIIEYTGNGASGGATLGHGLDNPPEFGLFKTTSKSNNWMVYHKDVGNERFLFFDLTNAQTGTSAQYWDNTTPDSNVWYFQDYHRNNESGTDYIAYCFHSVEGFSKIGSYTGNGNADGAFVYTGFRPAFVMIKRTDTSGVSWYIKDTERNPYNVADLQLYANLSDAEATSSAASNDMLSNGFKLRGTSGGVNASGGTYIYMAFAENPFKYSLAR